MKEYKRDTKKISIIINLIIVLWMAYCTYNIFSEGLGGNMSGNNITAFRYYTIDSNVFAAISALVMLIARITKGQPGSFATNFKYYGTCTVTVTLITVAAFLGPTIGYKEMFVGDNLYMHLIGPLLCVVSFCFADRGHKITIGHARKSLVPTIVYGFVYLFMVVVFKRWPDFYGFNIGGKWYISFAAMIIGAFVISIVIKALHNDKWKD